ncbi:MAG: hydrolase [Chloroflexi bacterium GWB2_49_20]|nr:MAG: hydrolase [Chloroflexi bacterium GWB2_49_20]OGN78899.1 MAG: hydrolase [Chloroflexi bacterium GWC2_49_37]OGN86340.1 MAG: hydrolase [Chloroflexi bacterium GWD2_49_16]HBG74572.1 putative aminohydrolase SsnA [Anaerolineae bacterium]
MLITHATIITWEIPNRILEDYAIYIKNDLIYDVGPQNKIINQYPDEFQLDANDQLVLPGNICAHTHFYGAFSRGMAIPGSPPKDFPEILSKLWWPLDRSLTHEDIYYSALVCMIDAIKHGTTSLIDHHSSPNAVEGSLDIIASAVRKSGIRCVLCYEVSDRNGQENANAGITENIRFLNSLKSSHSDLSTISGTFGLHASLTLSSKTLSTCREISPKGIGFHIHAAESSDDEYDSISKYGVRVIDRLDMHHLLGPNSIVAHAVHVDSGEIFKLLETQTWVTHQPRSNMNNGVGVAPVESFLRSGIKLCLGNDGFSNAMWEEWKTAYLLQKLWNHDPRSLSGNDVVQMAIYNNAALANTYFPKAPIGTIIPGAFADIIFVDYKSPTPLNSNNLPWHIIFGFQESMVTTTIVGGKILMKDRQLTSLDENEIASRARTLANQVWKRYESNYKT